MARILVAAVVAVSVLAGCSDGTQGTSTPKGPTYTAAQAQAALALATDLPTGYRRDATYQHDGLPRGCGAVDKVLSKEGRLAPSFAVVSYANGDAGGSVDHEVELYATPTQAATQFADLIAALKKCPSWQISLGGTSATLRLTPTRPGAIGGTSELLDLEVSSEPGTFRGKEVLAVSGNAIVSVAESGPAGNDDDPRVDLLALSRKLVQRLRQLAG